MQCEWMPLALSEYLSYDRQKQQHQRRQDLLLHMFLQFQRQFFELSQMDNETLLLKSPEMQLNESPGLLQLLESFDRHLQEGLRRLLFKLVDLQCVQRILSYCPFL